MCRGLVESSHSQAQQVNLGVVIKEGVTSVAGHVILASHVTRVVFNQFLNPWYKTHVHCILM